MLRKRFSARKSGQEAAVTNNLKPARRIIFADSQREAVASESTHPGSPTTRHELKAQLLNQQRRTPAASRILHATAVATRARPNPSLSPRPATAGVVSPVRAIRSIITNRAYNTCLRGRG
jgi:hypothetical protein